MKPPPFGPGQQQARQWLKGLRGSICLLCPQARQRLGQPFHSPLLDLLEKPLSRES
jgi:hypothetical protein